MVSLRSVACSLGFAQRVRQKLESSGPSSRLKGKRGPSRCVYVRALSSNELVVIHMDGGERSANSVLEVDVVGDRRIRGIQLRAR